MKKTIVYRIALALAVAVACLLPACTPGSYELDATDVTEVELVEGIAYTVTHDTENPNIIYLKSKMPSSYKVSWIHPQGNSQEPEVTLNIAFAGTYEVKFGVMTRGGVVYGEPTTFTIDEFYAGFVEGELWTNLTGGVGSSKTWVYDNGSYGFAGGELTYSDPANPLGWGIPASGWDPGAGHTGDNAIWDSYMTFSLSSGANVTIHNTYIEDGQVKVNDENGTFTLNEDTHTITFSNCQIMHTQEWTWKSTNWATDLTIVALDENHLQVGVMRGGVEVSGEDPWWLVWNFVSKEYADNYVPGETTEPEPALPDGWKDDVSQLVTTKIKWAMSADTPFDWANLDGSLMNNFEAGAYPDWAPVQPNLDQLTMELDSKDMTYTFIMPDGTSTSGTYTLDEKGIYTFDNGVPSYLIGGDWLYFQASDDNQLRILKIETIGGTVSGMWLGVRSGDEYIAYHFIPNAGSGSEGPQTKVIAVDNSKIVYGNLESDKNNFRIELYNMYGSTSANSPINPSEMVFDYSFELTFTINGLSGVAATNEYTASLMLTGDGWWPQYNSQEDVKIQGNGTYTISMKPDSAYNGVIVFCIDIINMFSDIADPSAVTVTIDNLEIL